MNPNNDHTYFRAGLVRQTDNATLYLLTTTEVEHWVPNSLHEFRATGTEQVEGIVEVEAWFANKEGMGIL